MLEILIICLYKNSKFTFILQAIEEVIVDNEERAGEPGQVIEEPEFQAEVNQVDKDQIGEPPQPKIEPRILKFDGINYNCIMIVS